MQSSVQPFAGQLGAGVGARNLLVLLETLRDVARAGEERQGQVHQLRREGPIERGDQPRKRLLDACSVHGGLSAKLFGGLKK